MYPRVHGAYTPATHLQCRAPHHPCPVQVWPCANRPQPAPHRAGSAAEAAVQEEPCLSQAAFVETREAAALVLFALPSVRQEESRRAAHARPKTDSAGPCALPPPRALRSPYPTALWMHSARSQRALPHPATEDTHRSPRSREWPRQVPIAAWRSHAMMRSTVRSQDPSRNTEKGCCTKFSLRTAASPFAPATVHAVPRKRGRLAHGSGTQVIPSAPEASAP